MEPTHEQLQAIKDCDKQFDMQFYYGVSSTRIFCKPSCKSRMPKTENIIIEHEAAKLIEQGYRPCKRCRPTNDKLPDDAWIDLVMDYINHNFTTKLTLEMIAEETHSSPFHLHRKFKEIVGLTLRHYIIRIRMENAKELLLESGDSIASIGSQIGIQNSPQFVRDFKKYQGITPKQYREEHHHENNQLHHL